MCVKTNKLIAIGKLVVDYRKINNLTRKDLEDKVYLSSGIVEAIELARSSSKLSLDLLSAYMDNADFNALINNYGYTLADKIRDFRWVNKVSSKSLAQTYAITVDCLDRTESGIYTTISSKDSLCKALCISSLEYDGLSLNQRGFNGDLILKIGRLQNEYNCTLVSGNITNADLDVLERVFTNKLLDDAISSKKMYSSLIKAIPATERWDD